MGLDAAIAKADELRDALEAELERAHADRGLLRELDAEPLLKSALRRAEFNARAARLQQEIADALAVAGAQLDLIEISMPSLSAASPAAAGELARVFAQIRSRAAALAKVDARNRSTAERALACVQGYLTALSLHPQAYDRRGYNLAPGGDRATCSLRI
jgi:hypothetical protein